MGIAAWDRDFAGDLIGCGLADKDISRVHAGQVPGCIVLGEDNVFAHHAARHRDPFQPVRELIQFKDIDFRPAERGDVGLVHVAVVKDVMGDQIRRQRYGHQDLAEA